LFLYEILSGKHNKPGSTGQNFMGVNNIILDPDSEKCGEIAMHARNTFMGYHANEEKNKRIFH